MAEKQPWEIASVSIRSSASKCAFADNLDQPVAVLLAKQPIVCSIQPNDAKGIAQRFPRSTGP